MSDKSAIEWTDATWIVDRNGKRVRFYKRKNPARPGQRQRRSKKRVGLAWCRGCRTWLPVPSVRSGVCKAHANAEYRAQYAAGAREGIAARVHARKRGVAVLPVIGAEYLLELFGGKCAYCREPATTWDHLVPVSHGGETAPGNIVPACRSCNSSKKNHEVFGWAFKRGIDVAKIYDVLMVAF